MGMPVCLCGMQEAKQKVLFAQDAQAGVLLVHGHASAAWQRCL